MSARRLPPPSHPNQMELPLDLRVTATPGMSIARMPDGEIRIRPTATVELEGSTMDAARILGVSDRTVRTLVAEGRLRARRPGKRWLRIDLLHARSLREQSRV